MSLARALSKLGYCSRKKADGLVREGRVSLDGTVEKDPSVRLDLERDQIRVDGELVSAAPRVYLLLNKPRGLVTSTADEKGRDTVYRCLADTLLPWLSPVGRLDQASEGLLLFTNDTHWGAAISSPESGVEKTYHAKIDRVPDEDLLRRLEDGLVTDRGERLAFARVRALRRGTKTGWLEIGLNEGKNREIRRLLEALDLEVLRLVRVAIGPLRLGDLAKGAWRFLTDEEKEALMCAARPRSPASQGRPARRWAGPAASRIAGPDNRRGEERRR